MASYHRVLSAFDRSVGDKNLECNCDIHSWELRVNGERWFGKIRLIGFVDVFFLICYSANDRFQHGIIVYKEDEDIRQTLIAAKRYATDPDINLQLVNPESEDDEKVPNRYFSFVEKEGDLDYTITSLGHPVDLRTNYSPSELKKYEIKIRRPPVAHVKWPIWRGITQHTVPQLMHDAVRYGFISHSEMTAKFMGQFVGGTHTEDTFRKMAAAFGGGGNGHTAAA